MSDLRWTWRLAIRDDDALSSLAKLLGHTLALHMEPDGGNCYPSVATLALEMGVVERSVQNGRRELEERGYLDVDKRGGRRTGGAPASSTYRPLLPSNPARGAPLTRHLVPPNPACGAPEKDREKDIGEGLSGASNDKSPLASEQNGNHSLTEDADEALRDLVDSLVDADHGTYGVFARDFGSLDAEAFWYALDEVEKRRDPDYRRGTQIAESDAGYARGILENVAAGYSSPPERAP